MTAPIHSRPNVSDLLARPATATVPKDDLSMKAHVIFESCWKRVEAKWGNRYVAPREVVWLNGAPGSGKGTNIPFIIRTRGLSRSVGMSQLLDGTPEIKGMIDRGELIPDTLVLDALFDALLNPDVNDGAGMIIDGFPRTALQVDFVKLLHDRLLSLATRHAGGPEEWRFPRPSFKVVILYVDEEESLRRQSRRARMASLHNARVMDAGTGDMWDVRTTDVNEALCRRRYQVFKAHYHTILRLKQFFPFSLIDAMGTPEECRSQIARELRYQSSLDLDAETYAAIRHLPLARDLVRVARQRLVYRLDSYCRRQKALFTDVTRLIASDLVPLLKKCSLAGHAVYRSSEPLLVDHPAAVDMLIDVLSDRGFAVAHSAQDTATPVRVDLKTGEITCSTSPVHVFRITFDKENVRDLSTPQSVTTKSGEDVAIGTTFIPTHLQREDAHRLAELRAQGMPTMEGAFEAAARAEAEAEAGDPDVAAVAKARVAADHELTNADPAAATVSAAVEVVQSSISGPSSSAVASSSSSSAKLASSRSARDGGYERAATRSALESRGDLPPFLKGWESMDAELSARGTGRYYGFDKMNERED